MRLGHRDWDGLGLGRERREVRGARGLGNGGKRHEAMGCATVSVLLVEVGRLSSSFVVGGM